MRRKRAYCGLIANLSSRSIPPTLIRFGDFRTDANTTEGFIDCELPPPTADDRGYWPLPTLRWSAVDTDTFKPIGQEMPVLWSGQYPHGFLCRYCWW